MTVCHVPDDQRLAFADGVDDSLDDHVMDCDFCQAFLADLWQDELDRDLTEPVMKMIGLEELVMEIIKLGGGILARYGEAAKTYGAGREPEE